jgi:hypothetical protein
VSGPGEAKWGLFNLKLILEVENPATLLFIQ